jgi:F-type H+-transporting ATPase subunit delta
VAAKDIARVYASSLIELGTEKKILPDLEEEIKFIAGMISDDRNFRHFLTSPGITKDAKKESIEKIFKGKLSDYMVNFIKVLIDNDRQSAIPEIYEMFTGLIDEVNNRQRVTIITSVDLDSTLKGKLTAKLKDVFKKEIILKEEIDPSILGGIIIKVGDTVIDGSLAKDLRNIKLNMLNSKVRSEAAYED